MIFVLPYLAIHMQNSFTLGEKTTSMPRTGGTGDNVQVPPIEPLELEYGPILGEGCFGVVHRGLSSLCYVITACAGRCRGQDVAIKKLHVRELDEEVMEEFRKEISILTYVSKN
jgi:hypothetical protein